MRKIAFRLLLAAAAFFCLTSCLMEIKIQAPRWKYSLTCNGVTDRFECVDDTYPVSMEYSVPEFFAMEDGKVVFRFFYKETGFKLQAANDGPFRNKEKYSFAAGDEFFEASFDWLYGGKEYKCDSGWVMFKRNILPGTDYTVDFEFDLSAPDGSKMEIRDGVFTVFSKVEPRGSASGIE